MKKKYAVIGLGRFGRTVATTLANEGAEVLAIDLDMNAVERIKDEVALAVNLDSEDNKALESQNIQEYDVVIVAIGNHFESMLLTTVNLMNSKVKRIIARAMNKTQRSILHKLGLEDQDIISPEVQVGESIARSLLQPDIQTFLELADQYEVAKITAPPKVANQSVIDLDLRKNYNINLIAIERVVSRSTKDEDHTPQKKILGITDPQAPILEQDALILIGKQYDIQKFIDLNS